MNFVKMINRYCLRRFLIVLVLQFAFASFTMFSVNIRDVSAAPVSPYIAVVPEQTVNSTLTVGMNYTVSIYTDCAESDIWAWQFSLTFDPYVLNGGRNTTDTWTQTGTTRKTWYATKPPIIADTEKIYLNDTLVIKPANYTIDYGTGKVTFTTAPPKGTVIKAVYLGYSVVNGDLITTAKDPSAQFLPGTVGFNNTAGKLSLVGAYFDYLPPAIPPTTFGPGILANVTFRVVGTGISNIALGNDTQLIGYSGLPPPDDFPKIIDAATMPDHIGHGRFDNLPNVHDVAVSKLVIPTFAIPGDIVAINVTVRNEGSFAENFDVTVYVNTTLVGTQISNLARDETATLRFDWNTTDLVAGNYLRNATALLAGDIDLSDNVKSGQTEVKSVHDVAIIGLEIPAKAIIGSITHINVTVKNEGNIEEDVTLTTSYEQLFATNPPVVINTTNFVLAERPTSIIVSVSWNTTGLALDDYRINATATIMLDEDTSDNTQTGIISLTPPTHDVAVIAISATPEVFLGERAAINVTVRNDGTFVENLVKVNVTCEGAIIESRSTSLLLGESRTLSFSWDTTGVGAGIYTVAAEAILEGDPTPANNLKVAAVVVKTPLPGHIVGIVTDASTGDPIEGANVTASGYFDITDASGHFNITNVPVGTYNVTASANGYHSSSKFGISVATLQTTSLSFTLTSIPTTGHVAGIVTDASTEDPIEGANVTANGHSVLTNADGSYNIELQPGTYTVTVSANGYEDSSQTNIAINAGESTAVNFELTPVEPANILPYLLVGVIVAVIIIAGIAIYFFRVRKK